MGFIQDVFPDLWVVMLCIDVGILVVSGVMGPLYPIHTPFNAAVTVNGTALPNIYNGNDSSTGLVSQVSSHVQNATSAGGFGNFLNLITGGAAYILNVIWAFVMFLTGGFAFQVLGMFGFPMIFILGLQAIFGFFLVRSLIYFIVGR